MDTQPSFTLRDLLTQVIGEIAKALCDRPSESSHQRAVRIEAATHAIIAFQPRDAIEAMLAGHCLMFHELIVDSVRQTLRGEQATTQRATRSGIVAMDKAFGANLARLERYQARHADASPEAQTAHDPGETDIADRVRRHHTQSSVHQSMAPSPPTMAAPAETMAVLDVRDPPQFANAHAMGHPGERYLASAAQMSCLNGHTVENASQPPRCGLAGNRQARRHPTGNGPAIKPSAAAAN